MTKKVIQSNLAGPPQGAYSQGVRAGDFIFVSGCGPIDEAGVVVGDTIEEQTARTLENVRAILEAGGANMSDVVKSAVHLSDISLFPRFNRVYAEYFPDPKPARTTVGSLLNRIMVEIDVIAYVGKE